MTDEEAPPQQQAAQRRAVEGPSGSPQALTPKGPLQLYALSFAILLRRVLVTGCVSPLCRAVVAVVMTGGQCDRVEDLV